MVARRGPPQKGDVPDVSDEVPVLRFSRWDLFKGLAAIGSTVGVVSLALIYFFPALSDISVCETDLAA